MDWDRVRPVIEAVLVKQRYSVDGGYQGTPCFLTAYQIAVLADKMDPSLKGSLPVGGVDSGPDSFARQIAWHLSDDVKKDVFLGRLEIQFLSLAGLDDRRILFNDGDASSVREVSMFRMLS